MTGPYIVTLPFEQDGPAATGEWTDDITAPHAHRGRAGLRLCGER